MWTFVLVMDHWPVAFFISPFGRIFWWCRFDCGVGGIYWCSKTTTKPPKARSLQQTHLKCDETTHRGDELAERLSISSTRNPLPKSRHSILSSSQPLWDTWTNVVLRFPNVAETSSNMNVGCMLYSDVVTCMAIRWKMTVLFRCYISWSQFWTIQPSLSMFWNLWPCPLKPLNL